MMTDSGPRGGPCYPSRAGASVIGAAFARAGSKESIPPNVHPQPSRLEQHRPTSNARSAISLGLGATDGGDLCFARRCHPRPGADAAAPGTLRSVVAFV